MPRRPDESAQRGKADISPTGSHFRFDNGHRRRIDANNLDRKTHYFSPTFLSALHDVSCDLRRRGEVLQQKTSDLFTPSAVFFRLQRVQINFPPLDGGVNFLPVVCVAFYAVKGGLQLAQLSQKFIFPDIVLADACPEQRQAFLRIHSTSPSASFEKSAEVRPPLLVVRPEKRCSPLLRSSAA